MLVACAIVKTESSITFLLSFYDFALVLCHNCFARLDRSIATVRCDQSGYNNATLVEVSCQVSLDSQSDYEAPSDVYQLAALVAQPSRLSAAEVSEAVSLLSIFSNNNFVLDRNEEVSASQVLYKIFISSHNGAIFY